MPNQYKEIKIQINSLTASLFILALLVVGAVGYLSLGQGVRAAESPQAGSTGLRQYFVTSASTYDGSEANTVACGSGYHMASLWEVRDLSNLEYNATLGYYDANSDMGKGPPTNNVAWIRTGYFNQMPGDPAGMADCISWDTNNGAYNGTYAYLTLEPSMSMVVAWNTGLEACNIERSVWCVED